MIIPPRYAKFFLAVLAITSFVLLMLFGLKKNPNFTPSQLIGRQAPVLEGESTSGEKVAFFASNSGDEEKHWTVVNFWTTSCSVCRAEAPSLQKFYTEISQKKKTNPQLVSVNIQDRLSSVVNWQKTYGQTFLVLLDTQGFLSLNYGVTGTPESFFVSPEGVVKFRVAGEMNDVFIMKLITWLDKNPSSQEQDLNKILDKL